MNWYRKLSQTDSSDGAIDPVRFEAMMRARTIAMIIEKTYYQVQPYWINSTLNPLEKDIYKLFLKMKQKTVDNYSNLYNDLQQDYNNLQQVQADDHELV